VEFLRRVFGELYPTIRPAVVRARSIEIVAERMGITVEKLQGYLRRPRGDDHRLK
jgi:hypothetical protein